MPKVRHRIKDTVLEITDPDELEAVRANPDLYEIIGEEAPTQEIATTTIGNRQPIDLPPVPQPEHKTSSPLAALARGVAQGTTFNFADELEGLGKYGASRITGDTEKSLDEYINEARAGYKRAKREYPGLYNVGEYGSALIPVAGPLRAVKGISKGGKILNALAKSNRGVEAVEAARNAGRMGQQAIEAGKLAGKIAQEGAPPLQRAIGFAKQVAGTGVRGGVEGSLAGAGSAEGGLTDRLEGLEEGGKAGALTGVALPLASKALTTAGNLAIKKPVVSGIKSLYQRGKDPKYRNLLDDLSGTDQLGKVKRMQIEKGELEGLDLPGELSRIEKKQSALAKAEGKRFGELEKGTELLDQDIKDDLTRKITSDISVVSQNMDLVTDAANTSMKGSTAERSFKQWVTKQPPQEARAVQRTIFNESNNMFDAADSVFDDVISKAGKGLTDNKSAGAKAVQAKKALFALKTKMNDAIAGSGGQISPEAMSEAFIALDNLKRRVGTLAVKSKRDKIAGEPVKDLYEQMRQFLERKDLWGNDMSNIQKEINKAWSKYLDVAPAAEQAFMTRGVRSTEKAADPFMKISEGEARKIQGLVTDAGRPVTDLDIRIMNDYVKASDELANVLVKHYNNTPRLQAFVANIRNARKKIMSNMDNAYQDALNRRGYMASPADRAKSMIETAKSRGVQSPNIDSLAKSQERVRNIQKVSPRLESERQILSGESSAYSSDPTMRAAQQMQSLKKIEGDPWGPLPKSSTMIENLASAERVGRKTGEKIFGQAPGQMAGRTIAGEVAGISSSSGDSESAWNLAKRLWGDKTVTESELNKMDKPAEDEIRKQKSAEQAKNNPARHRAIP